MICKVTVFSAHYREEKVETKMLLFCSHVMWQFFADSQIRFMPE